MICLSLFLFLYFPFSVVLFPGFYRVGFTTLPRRVVADMFTNKVITIFLLIATGCIIRHAPVCNHSHDVCSSNIMSEISYNSSIKTRPIFRSFEQLNLMPKYITTLENVFHMLWEYLKLHTNYVHTYTVARSYRNLK